YMRLGERCYWGKPRSYSKSKSPRRRAIEKDHAGSIRPRRDKIGIAISIEIGSGQPVNRALVVAERDVAVMASRAVVEVDHTGSRGLSDDDVGCAILVEIGCQ